MRGSASRNGTTKQQEFEYAVIIPAFNAEATIGRQIEALLSQSKTEPFEIVIADNNSTDSTKKIIESYALKEPNVRVVSAPLKQGANYARNTAISATTASHILMCDADDIVSPDWARAYVEELKAGVQCLGGPLEYVSEKLEFLSFKSDLFDSGWGPKASAGCNAAFSRTAYDSIDGFDEDFRMGFDDIDFFWRLWLSGVQIQYCPKALVYYVQPSSLKKNFKKWFQYGKSTKLAYLKYRSKGMKKVDLIRPFLAVVIIAAVLPFVSHAKKIMLTQKLGRNAGLIYTTIFRL